MTACSVNNHWIMMDGHQYDDGETKHRLAQEGDTIAVWHSQNSIILSQTVIILH